jgi:hypothetical protein
LISWATPAASVPTDTIRSASWRRSIIRRRSVTSVQVPTMRSGSPPGPRATTRARPCIQRYSPASVRTRCSNSIWSRPAYVDFTSAPTVARSSGWTWDMKASPLAGMASSG